MKTFSKAFLAVLAVGTMLATVERFFPSLVRIGFASRFVD